MTDKYTLNSIDKVKNLLEQDNYTESIVHGKKIVDRLVLNTHQTIFKRKLIRKPAYPIKQAESILSFVETNPELKKIADKKTIKQTIKWYGKFKEFNLNPESKQAKKPAKFAKKTIHLLTLLNHSAIKVKSYFKK